MIQTIRNILLCAPKLEIDTQFQFCVSFFLKCNTSDPFFNSKISRFIRKILTPTFKDHKDHKDIMYYLNIYSIQSEKRNGGIYISIYIEWYKDRITQHHYNLNPSYIIKYLINRLDQFDSQIVFSDGMVCSLHKSDILQLNYTMFVKNEF